MFKKVLFTLLFIAASFSFGQKVGNVTVIQGITSDGDTVFVYLPMNVTDNFMVTTDGDTIWFLPYHDLYMFRMEVNNSDIFRVDSTGKSWSSDVTISDGTPVLNFIDEDGADNDVNFYIETALTTTTSGHEDADVIFRQQIDGLSTIFLYADPDGVIEIGGATHDTQTNGDLFVDGGDLTIKNTGVKLTASDGTLTLLGLGNGYDENFVLDLDNTENAIMASSSTGVTKFDFGTIDVETDVMDASDSTTTGALRVENGVLIKGKAVVRDSVRALAFRSRGLELYHYGLNRWGTSASFYIEDSVSIGAAQFRARLSVWGGDIIQDYSTGGATDGGSLTFNSNANNVYIFSNYYYSSGNKYARNGGSGQIRLDQSTGPTAGDISWWTAVSGTADAAITYNRRMTLKQNGNLALGSSYATELLHLLSSSYPQVCITHTESLDSTRQGTDSDGYWHTIPSGGRVYIHGDLYTNGVQVDSLATILNPDLKSNGESSAATFETDTAGTTIAAGDLVYEAADGHYELADATDGTTMLCTGIACGSASDGDTVRVMTKGYFRLNSWTWSKAGGISDILYVSETAGDATTTAPTTSGSYTQVIGRVKAEDIIFFNPSMNWVKHE